MVLLRSHQELNLPESLDTYLFFALSTAHRTAVHILAPKELLHLILDYALVIAKWAFL